MNINYSHTRFDGEILSDGASQIMCLGVDTGSEQVISLSSGMLCTGSLPPCGLSVSHFAARPANGGTLEHDDKLWGRIYKRAGMRLPDLRVALSVTRRIMPPIFDLGFIYTSQPIALAEEWGKIYALIKTEPAFSNDIDNAYRFALPLAVQRVCASRRWTCRAGTCRTRASLGRARQTRCPRRGRGVR